MAEREGKASPALASKPILLPRAVRFFNSFLQLMGSRNMNGTIPNSEILAHAELAGYRGQEDKRDLLRFINACDQAYLKTKDRIGGGSN